MAHGRMHNVKREPQQSQETDRIYNTFSRTTGARTDGDALSTAAVVSASEGPQSALTTVLQTVEETISQPGTIVVTTRTQTSRITDSAEYSSLRASESSVNAKATSSIARTSSGAAESSEASSGASSDNLITLIPAIVVPVAAVLIISFGLFWWIMRRRAQKQRKEEPEFVMANKSEKPKSMSRGNSNSSGHSSTRELVPLSKLEKEMAVTTNEVERSSFDLFPPKYNATDIGLARPMTPPDKGGKNAGASAKEMGPSIPNFSSVRPGTSHSTAPSQDRKGGPRSRSQTGSAPRGPPTPRSSSRQGPPQSARGPSPAMRGPAPPRPARLGDPAPRAGFNSPPRVAHGALVTNPNGGNRSAPLKAANPPTPTGAFNGASPISQYSPIVKDMPSFGPIVGINSAEQQRPVAPLKTTKLPSSGRTDSPVDGNVLSHENMRIARLANSSRLTFTQSPVEPSFLRDKPNKALPPLSEKNPSTEGPATSPQLPPPLTRADMPRAPFAREPDSPAGGSSIYPSPSIGTGATPQIGGGPYGFSTTSLPYSEHTVGVASSEALHNRGVSMVSRISSDDGYVDMDVDAKSDVSSLDEREKWEMESDRLHFESRLGTGNNGSGYDSASMSPVDGPAAPSSAGAGSTSEASGSTNLRDRDSEGPFVLSRYGS